MVALLRLCGPSRRGNRVNWNLDDEDDLLEQLEESTSPEEDTMECLIDTYIIPLSPHQFWLLDSSVAGICQSSDNIKAASPH
jgi:hypothetical protein